MNEIRIKTRDALAACDIAARIEGESGNKAFSWQEANEDLLSVFQIRNIIMYAVVGAILLVTSFGTYNIISTITHEKARDIGIMKLLGIPARTVRAIFVSEAIVIGLIGMAAGWVLGYFLASAWGVSKFARRLGIRPICRSTMPPATISSPERLPWPLP